MSPDVPARIGPYTVVGTLESGASGAVYQALDQAHARPVRLRALPPELVTDAPRLARFRRALQATSALDHDNLLRTYGEVRHGDVVYAVEAPMDGGALAERLERSRLTLAEAIRVIRGVADGLGAAHRAGLVHGDLNAGNVLVSKDLSAVKIGGFGAGCRPRMSPAARTATLALARVESELYRAPELASGGEATARSDIYSLGVVAYEVMTGKLPVGKFSLPSDVNSQVPLALDPIVLKCLATDPARRYQDVAALVRDLDTVEEVVGLRLLSEVSHLSVRRWFGSKRVAAPRRKAASRGPRYVVAGIALIGLAAAGAFVLLRVPGPFLPQAGTPSAAPGSAEPAAEVPPLLEPAAELAPLVSSALPGMPALATPMAVAPALLATEPEPPVPPGPVVAKPPATLAARAPPDRATPAAPLVPPGAGRSGAPPPDVSGPTTKPADAPAAARPASTAASQREAGSLYNEARVLIKKGQDAEARTKLALVGERYSDTIWFVPAMMVKIDLEDRKALRETDAVAGQAVPASVLTKRLLTERAPTHTTSEAALWQLGEFYDGIRQYAAAVEAFTRLGTRFPKTRFEAWFRAGEIAERRLKKRDDARAAYLKVPAASAHFKEAQERAAGLAPR